MMPRLILASTSVYRRELLGRLRLDFSTARPEVDEQAQPGERPDALASRLAAEKAAAVAAQAPDAWVIGSDGRRHGWPGPGQTGHAGTGACAADRDVRPRGALPYGSEPGRPWPHRARAGPDRGAAAPLTPAGIDRYLAAEPALDCAGSFKCEGFGISLFDAIRSQDPTALVGLPLIALARLLRQAGFEIP